MPAQQKPYHVCKTIDGAHTSHIGYADTYREAIQMAIEYHAAHDAICTEIYGPGSHSMGSAYYWRHLADFIDERHAYDEDRRRFEETTQ